MALAAAVGLLTAGGLAGYFITWKGSARANKMLAPVPFRVQEIRPHQVFPDGNQVAFAWNSEIN
jgi:hypothetical protein